LIVKISIKLIEEHPLNQRKKSLPGKKGIEFPEVARIASLLLNFCHELELPAWAKTGRPKGNFAMPLTKRNRQELWEAAIQVQSRAYAPYSRIRVGASLLTARGQIYTGANVENASYSLSLCAERAALAQAVAVEGRTMHARALAVVSDHPGPFAPCGACRQVIFEFGPEALVLFQGEAGILEVPLNDLFPQAFRLPR